TQDVEHGSALVAWNESQKGAPFTVLHISDAVAELSAASATRLTKVGAPVTSYVGTAVDSVDQVVPKLNKYALHFAFLDPYNLAHLPFEIIKKLASLERMDILMHVSLLDLQRNLKKYLTSTKSCPLDTFAPGWREKVGSLRDEKQVRGRVMEHWRGLIKGLGL